MLSKFLRKCLTSQGRADIRFFVSRAVVNPLLRPCGFTLIADHFYQPIPNQKEAALYASKPRPCGGCSFHYEEQVTFIADLLQAYKQEINSPDDLCAAGYRMANGGFGSGDAEVLYCLIRHLKPSRIIEVGAGTSTQVILAALRRNVLGGAMPSSLTSIDPYPSVEAVAAKKSGADYVAHELITARIQDVPLGIFKTLGDNDILFVDSSHVFKSGSDVEHEFLNVYPVLNKGVWVHVHDIFLPFDYPTSWNNNNSFFWNEQYILEAFLQFNSAFRVRAVLNMVARRDPNVFTENIGRYREDRTPASLWMQRIG